jgi:hypothetical protein
LQALGLLDLFNEHVVFVLEFVVLADDEGVVSAIFIFLLSLLSGFFNHELGFFEGWKQFRVLLVALCNEEIQVGQTAFASQHSTFFVALVPQLELFFLLFDYFLVEPAGVDLVPRTHWFFIVSFNRRHGICLLG